MLTLLQLDLSAVCGPQPAKHNDTALVTWAPRAADQPATGRGTFSVEGTDTAHHLSIFNHFN